MVTNGPAPVGESRMNSAPYSWLPGPVHGRVIAILRGLRDCTAW